MSNRASVVGRGNDALFVKDGSPVKFCFHKSVTQGRGQITRDVEQRGGKIVSDEPEAQVLLVDEQEDIAFLRRRYYSSTALYRLSIYVEPRGFVQKCIRSGTYEHVGPAKQGMPGRPPGRSRRGVRVPFTEEDRDNLAYYLATRLPTRDGRMGNSAYKDLERLGQSDDPFFVWARQHTWHSWREHYKNNSVLMDTRINAYVEELKDIGHHLGHDVRTHDRWQIRQEEEESGNNEEQEQRRAIRSHRSERREQQGVHPAAATRQERDPLRLDEEERDVQEEEVSIQEHQPAKRHRFRADAQGERDAHETHVKRTRVSEASSHHGSDIDASIPAHESGDESSQEIEGSDLFGDRAYENESRFAFDDAQKIDFPMPYSPRGSPVPEPNDALLSTQTTLVASPLTAQRGKEPNQVPGLTLTKVVEAKPLMSKTTVPPTTRERVVAPRARVRGASAQPGPSVPKEMPYRNTRSKSRPVEPPSQPQRKSRSVRQREDREGRGKGKARDEALIPIEEDVQVDESSPREAYTDKPVIVTGGLSTRETLEDEMVVEGLLQASIVDDKDEESDGSIGGRGEDDEISDADEGDDVVTELPPYQELENNPTDSDDAETHGSLVRGSVQGSTGENRDSGQDRDQNADQQGDVDEGSQSSEGQGRVQEQNENEDSEEDSDADADRIERMARGMLQVLPGPAQAPSERKVTRSKAPTRARTEVPIEISPRRTRSGRARAGFPSPGTKARAVVDRLQDEEKHVPYEPPVGSRAARAVRGRGKRM